MTFSTSSIRSKIWLCVSIALAGYFIATVSGYYTNVLFHERLSHMQHFSYPLASQADHLLHVFEDQVEKYETSFLVGEKELASKANLLQPVISGLIDELTLSVEQSTFLSLSKKDLMELKQTYQDFASMASEVYLKLAAGDECLNTQEKVQKLGQMQLILIHNFKGVSEAYHNALFLEIESNKTMAFKNSFYLSIFFLIMLILVALIVDRVSSRLLVVPLSAIGENVKRFLFHQDILKPANTDPADEIGHLAMSFWEMTEKLKKTTVSKNYVDDIIRNMSGALVVVRPDLTIQTINHQCCKMFDYPSNELLDQSISELFISSENGTTSVSIIDEILTVGMVKDAEFYCQTRTGKAFPVHFSGSVMYSEERELQGAICIFNDITELKDAEKKLNTRVDEFQKLSTLGQYSAKLAHELGTPLHVIQGNVDIVEDLVESPKIHDRLTVVNRQIDKMQSMIKNFMAAFKSSEPKYELVDISNFLHEFEKTMCRFVIPKDIDFSVQSTNLSAIMDVNFVEQVLQNFIKNSVESIGEEKQGTIHLEAKILENQLIMTVADSGEGVKKKDEEHLFKPLYSTKKSSTGTGLGLVVCKEIIEAMGGTIFFRRESGLTIFGFNIPCNR